MEWKLAVEVDFKGALDGGRLPSERMPVHLGRHK